MAKTTLNTALASSVNPQELSLTIKGAIISAVPIIALILKAAGSEIDNDSLQSFVNALTDFVVAAGTTASLGMMLYGACRKIYFALTK